MSEFKIEVVEIGKIEKHPNADNLSITHIHDGYPVIIRTGDFKEGDKAVYVPVDSVIPLDAPKWAFLNGHNRIKAKKLRGVFSMGLLVQADSGWYIGQDVREVMNIVKYEPPEPLTVRGENEHCPFAFPNYTDVEALRRWPDILEVGEEVILTEKLHGASSKYVFHDGQLWVGSHHNVKKYNPDNMWWKVAEKYQLEKRLAEIPDYILYGETYGNVQDLKYGASKNDLFLAFFDAFSLASGKYVNWDSLVMVLSLAGLLTFSPPILYRGPWAHNLVSLSDGPSLVPRANHVREGFVVKPTTERFHDSIGRVILKMHGEDYLTRK